MGDAYTVFWSQDRCQAARTVAGAGLPLTVLFGGPHLSLPSFTRARVTAGDVIYPIGVAAQRVHVLGRMRVTEVREFTVSEYGALRAAIQRFPPWHFLTGGCLSEVVLGAEGTPIRLDAVLGPTELRRLTYRSMRTTRTLRHVDDDGLLTHTHGVQGIYRLAPHSAADLDTTLAA